MRPQRIDLLESENVSAGLPVVLMVTRKTWRPNPAVFIQLATTCFRNLRSKLLRRDGLESWMYSLTTRVLVRRLSNEGAVVLQLSSSLNRSYMAHTY